MRPFVPLLIFLLLGGCTTRHPKASTTYTLQKQNTITITLYKEYLKWEGTPNRYGGNSFNGIDCSAFVQSVYRDAFGIQIPRSTQGQMYAGHRVSKNAIKEGDLLLFDTGNDTRHSGIYLENESFIHSSSRYGVTISTLKNPYWTKTYMQTRRVLP